MRKKEQLTKKPNSYEYRSKNKCVADLRETLQKQEVVKKCWPPLDSPSQELSFY